MRHDVEADRIFEFDVVRFWNATLPYLIILQRLRIEGEVRF